MHCAQMPAESEEKTIKRSVSFPTALLARAQAVADATYGGNFSLVVQLAVERFLENSPAAAAAEPPVMTVLREIRDLLKAGAGVPASLLNDPAAGYGAIPNSPVKDVIEHKAQIVAHPPAPHTGAPAGESAAPSTRPRKQAGHRGSKPRGA
jgi:hypothetical protein